MPQEKNQRQRETGLGLTQSLLGTGWKLEGAQVAHPPKQFRGAENLSCMAEVVKTKGSGLKKPSLGSWDKLERGSDSS